MNLERVQWLCVRKTDEAIMFRCDNRASAEFWIQRYNVMQEDELEHMKLIRRTHYYVDQAMEAQRAYD